MAELHRSEPTARPNCARDVDGPPREPLVCSRRERSHRRRRGLARKLLGQHRGAPTGAISEVPNAYSAACLRCRDLLLRRPRVESRGRRRQDRRARRGRAQGHQARQPHPRAPRAAASCAPAADARPRRPATTRATCCAATSSATPRATARRCRAASAATRARTGSARTSPRSRARAARARRVVRMWMASPGHRAVLLSPSGRRIGVGAPRGQAGEREAGGLHRRPRLAPLGPAPRRRLALPS